jgi:Carboxypeptidase regulatory-like domain
VRRLGWMWVAAVCCGVGWAQTAPQNQNKREAKLASGARYEITGVVVNSVNGSPVGHCRMTASSVGRPGAVGGFGGNRQFPAPSNDGIDCDDRGRFTVTVPSAGAWRLMASARGFVGAAYDQHEQFSSAVVLTVDAPAKELVFRLSPEATITGVVLDEAGEAVRNAQIMLQSVPTQVAGGVQPAGAMRGAGRTDDRGRYELSNLAPGDYRLSVTAQPWYAAVAQVQRVGATTDTSGLDPSLDFTYAQTWFPGVDDPARAEVIKLHAGDTREADFNMIPIPSIHLRILVPPRVQTVVNTAAGSQSGPPPPAPVQVPMVQRLSPGAFGGGFVQTSARFDSDGQVDVGGLTPGTYQVRLMGPNQDGRTALVEVTANSVRTVDMSTPSRDMARITVHVDGSAADPADEPSEGEGRGRNFGVQVSLIDVDTRRGSFSTMTGQGPMNGGRPGQRDPNADRVIEAPPGRYEVVLQGRGNVFLTGLAAKGAETAGRYVTVGAGESALTVHTASGRASVSGFARMDGKAAVGAMVLLVPVTIEDPNSITVLRQDQTNTDGSFDIANVIPGQYILMGIDHGWGVNWGDASTLRRYLMQGVPLELKSSAVVKQNVEAQSP